MNRLDEVFARDRKVLVTYLCVGDPTIDESVELALACATQGADVIELGVPFSDPTADGVAIARASQRAIAAGGGLVGTLRAARAIRAAAPKIGIVLFGYYNPLFVRGEARVALEAADAGVDALLVVDLPVEESASLCALAGVHGIGVIPLLAPTSRAERILATRDAAKRGPVPFVYYVAVTGVTGSAALDAHQAGVRAAELQIQVGRPVAVGFGIDSREKARDAAALASGVVVGSAIVRAIEQGRGVQERRSAVASLVRDLRAGVDEASA